MTGGHEFGTFVLRPEKNARWLTVQTFGLQPCV